MINGIIIDSTARHYLFSEVPFTQQLILIVINSNERLNSSPATIKLILILTSYFTQAFFILFAGTLRIRIFARDFSVTIQCFVVASIWLYLGEVIKLVVKTE